VDVGLAADSRSVSQSQGDALDRGGQVSLGHRGAFRPTRLLEKTRRKDRPGPGAKILGGDIRAGDGPQIVVDVARRDSPQFLLLIQILQQFLPGQLLTRPDDLRDAAIAHRKRPSFAALADKLEAYLGPFDRHMPALQRRQPVALVLLCVFVVAPQRIRVVSSR
jgi:hypothetical protein